MKNDNMRRHDAIFRYLEAKEVDYKELNALERMKCQKQKEESLKILKEREISGDRYRY